MNETTFSINEVIKRNGETAQFETQKFLVQLKKQAHQQVSSVKMSRECFV